MKHTVKKKLKALLITTASTEVERSIDLARKIKIKWDNQ